MAYNSVAGVHTFNCLHCGKVVEHTTSPRFPSMYAREIGFTEVWARAKMCESCFRKRFPDKPATGFEKWVKHNEAYGWKLEKPFEFDDGTTLKPTSMEKTCEDCKGSGEIKGYECQTCDGLGKQTIDFKEKSPVDTQELTDIIGNKNLTPKEADLFARIIQADRMKGI